MRAIKEMCRTPKSRSDVRQGRTRDRPSGREPQGDGVPIVVVRFTPHQGGRESRPQGEGAQATEYRRPGGMRNAERRNGTRCPAASNRAMVAGEPGELKGSRRVREGGVGKGPQGTSPAPYLGHGPQIRARAPIGAAPAGCFGATTPRRPPTRADAPAATPAVGGPRGRRARRRRIAPPGVRAVGGAPSRSTR